jgi:hypothetical protein
MNNLKDHYQKHEGKSSDKWDIYLSTYDDFLQQQKSSVSSILEIGVQNGGSLEIWSKYFPSVEKLIGCDINPKCKDLDFQHPGIKVVIGDSSTLKTKNEITSLSSSFDLIIDDGSHMSSYIIKSFLLYFPLVEEGGIYIIEDLHASYWREFEGGLLYPYSSMAYLKKLADVPNKEHWGITLSESEYLSPFYDFYDCKNFDAVNYSQIHSVTFVNSLCIIKKKAAAENALGVRNLAGNLFDVYSNHKDTAGLTINVPSQNKHIWSRLKKSPEFEWADLMLKQPDAGDENISLSDALQRADKINVERFNSLQNDLLAKDKLILQLTNRNEALLNSTSWRITKPLRALMTKIRGK